MIGGVLELITAVVVGAIVDLTPFLGKAVILLHKFKLKVIPLILLGIGFGSIRYFLGF